MSTKIQKAYFEGISYSFIIIEWETPFSTRVKIQISVTLNDRLDMRDWLLHSNEFPRLLQVSIIETSNWALFSHPEEFYSLTCNEPKFSSIQKTTDEKSVVEFFYFSMSMMFDVLISAK